jgi:dipeptidyl aminopeptidase/acylaminoacyl peptidase
MMRLSALIIVFLSQLLLGNLQLFDNPDIQSISLSPNGKFVAYVNVKSSENIRIVIRNLDNGQKSGFNLIQNSQALKYWFNLFWKTNDRLVISIGSTQRGPGPVYAINRDGSDLTTVMHSENSASDLTIPFIVSPLRSDSAHILIKQYQYRGNRISVNYYKTNIYDGDIELKASDSRGKDFFLFDRLGNALIAAEYHEEAWHYYESSDGQWTPLEISIDGSTPEKIVFSGKKYLQRHHVFLNMGFNSDIIHFASNVKSDKMNLYEYNRQSRTTRLLLEAKGKYDLVDGQNAEIVNSLRYSAKSKSLIGLQMQTEKPQAIWFSQKFSQVQKFLDQKFPANVNHLMQWDNSENVFLIRSHSSYNPGEYYVLNLLNQSLDLVGYDYYALKDQTLNPTYAVEFNTRDQFLINGYVTLPDSNFTAPYPLLVDVHGGPSARDKYGYSASAQYYSKAGYAYLRVNFRGSTGMGYRYFSDGRRNYGMIAIADIRDAVNALVRDKIVDADRIGIAGASYGGYATLMSLIKYPELYKCGIATAAPSDLALMQTNHLPYLGKSLAFDFWEEMFGERDKLKVISPITHIEKLYDKPILLIHGDKDQIVEVNQSRRMRSKLEDKNPDFWYIELEMEGHGHWSHKNERLMHQKTLQYLKKYVK